MTRRPARLARVAALLVVPLLAVTACGGSGGGEGISASATSSSTSAAPETTSSSPEPSEESSSPEETATPATGIQLADVPGYTYGDAPADFATMGKALTDTGLVSEVKVVGLDTPDGETAVVLVAAQYTPEVTKSFEGMPMESILGGVAGGVKPSLTGKVTEETITVDGTDIVVLASPDLSVALVYFDGGLLAQMYGPDRDALVTAAKAFVTAQNAG
ncbi:hypothetical protein [Longivirga aurantiaca]|uniref:Uncharacterized protein n=1 Tax=Longivirga aurantiaca TaxID=1837743 RepID=A0ABW1SY07_9ACTN